MYGSWLDVDFMKLASDAKCDSTERDKQGTKLCHCHVMLHLALWSRWSCYHLA